VVKIPNEGKRTIGGHQRMIREGMQVGASDLFIAWPTYDFYGLWMEVKPDGWSGPKSKKEKDRVALQKAFLDKMKYVGYQGEFVIGVDEGIHAIKHYLGSS